MHGTFKKMRRRIRREAELRARREYYSAYKAQLNTFLRQPRGATEADKAVRKDNERTKELVNMARTRWPTIIEERIDGTVPAVAADGLPPWDKPRFDVGRFATYPLQYGGEIPDGTVTEISRAPVQDRFPWLTEVRWRLRDSLGRVRFDWSPNRDRVRPTSRGEKLPATWEDGNLADPKVTKGGISYEALLVKSSCPINLFAGPVVAQSVTRNGRVFRRRHVIKHSTRAWFGDDYAKRWNQAAPSYVDIRIAGKVRRVADGTWHAADESLDFLSTQERERKLEGWWGWRRLLCPIAFYEKPLLGFVLLWLMAGLDAPLRDFWFFAADAVTCDEGPALSHTAGLAREISKSKQRLRWTHGRHTKQRSEIAKSVHRLGTLAS
jgi:hypothetical protein